MLIFKRNQIVITALIVVILCAGYLNYKYNNAKLTSTNGNTPIGTPYFVENTDKGILSGDSTPTAKVSGDYFIITRGEKERTRDEQKDMLQNIIDNKNVDKDAKAKAQDELMNITRNIEKETVIEGVLKGKGFSDVLAFINDNKVDIVIKDETNLLPSQQAMILDVVTRETGAIADNVKIHPYKAIQDNNKAVGDAAKKS